MRILITGGRGLLAGRISNFLAREGHQVTLISRKCVSIGNLQTQLVDWDSPSNLKKLCDAQDVVIHASGLPAELCFSDPVKAFSVNCANTASIAAAAAEARVKKFVYLSSAHVYSAFPIGDIGEDFLPDNKHPYATSHLAGELAAQACSDVSDMTTIVVRLSNSFGYSMIGSTGGQNLFVNQLVQEAIQLKRITIKSSVNHHRDFIPLRDVLDILYFFTTKSDVLEHRVYNVASGTTLSLLEMAKKIQMHAEAISGSDIKIHEQFESEQKTCFKYNVDRIASLGLLKKVNYDPEISQMVKAARGYVLV